MQTKNNTVNVHTDGNKVGESLSDNYTAALSIQAKYFVKGSDGQATDVDTPSYLTQTNELEKRMVDPDFNEDVEKLVEIPHINLNANKQGLSVPNLHTYESAEKNSDATTVKTADHDGKENRGLA